MVTSKMIRSYMFIFDVSKKYIHLLGVRKPRKDLKRPRGGPRRQRGNSGTKDRTTRVQNSNISFDWLQNMNLKRKSKRFKSVNVEKPLVLIWFAGQPRSTQIEIVYKTAVEIRIPVKK